MADYEPYVAGEWRGTEETIEVRDLADGGTFAAVGAADGPLVEEALATADGARAVLRETTVPERVGWLRGIAEGIEVRREELADAIVRAGGKTISRTRGGRRRDRTVRPRHRRGQVAPRRLPRRDHGRPRGLVGDARAGARRRRRLHHAVQLPAGDPGAPDRARAGGG